MANNENESKKRGAGPVVAVRCQNPECGKMFDAIPSIAKKRKCCSKTCAATLSSIRTKGKTKGGEKKLLSRQTHRGTRSRAGDDARLKKQEPDKLPTKPVDTVTPWYRDPSAPGNKLVQTKNPKPGYIPLNRNRDADN